jgi:hypothetical protein
VAGLNKTHIILPNIGTILKSSELEMLQIQVNASVHLKEINDVIDEVVKIRDRAKLDTAAVLGDLRQVDPTPSTHTYWIIGISICTLILVIISCCYYRNPMRNWSRIILWGTERQRPIPQPRRRNKDDSRLDSSTSTVDTVLPLHVIVNEPSGGEQEEAETELNGNEREPTPFVSRGRVPVS